MKKIGILVSGRGSNMTAIIDACKRGYLLANVVIIISDNPDAKALIIAKERKISTIHFDIQVCKNLQLLDTSICKVLHNYQVDLVFHFLILLLTF